MNEERDVDFIRDEEEWDARTRPTSDEKIELTLADYVAWYDNGLETFEPHDPEDKGTYSLISVTDLSILEDLIDAIRPLARKDEELEKALRMARSIAQSGERWTDEAETAYRAALKEARP